MDKQQLLLFLQSQKLLGIATVEENQPWICNVYFSMNDKFELLFLSNPLSNHGQHILKNQNIAFSTSWFDKENLGNRKGVQGKGSCELLSDENKIIEMLNNHYKFFPGWEKSINYKNIKNDLTKSKPYLIKPSYMKFWNDELFGKEEIKEFNF